MDITLVRSSDSHKGLSDGEDDAMALKGSQVQGDYSGYVPPEVVVTSDSAAPTSSRRTSRTKPPPAPKGGTIRPESPTEVPVEVRGNLQKLGKRLKGWHQRYFEIQGQHMYYYKNYTKKECLGEIKLANCYFCDATSAATFGHAFELHTTERSHTLATRTRDEMTQWVRVIRKNMGITEQEAAAKKAAKPKRWESFKQALSIQPRERSQPKPVADKKKRKSTFGNRFKIGKDKSSPAPSRGNAHVPIEQDPAHLHTEAQPTRPMSMTEDEMGQDTLAILAALQPTRSLPATPLTTKRPVNFNESPSHISYNRDSTASPALTLDSTLSTPSHSITTSPAHSVTSPAHSVTSPAHSVTSPGPEIKEVQVEVTSEPANELTSREIEEVKEQLTLEPAKEPASQELPTVMVTESFLTEAELTKSETENEKTAPADLDNEVTPKASLEELPIELEPTSPERGSDYKTMDLNDLALPADPEFVTKKKFTWEDIREVLDTAEDSGNDYSALLPEEKAWLSKETGVEQLKSFLLTCP